MSMVESRGGMQAVDRIARILTVLGTEPFEFTLSEVARRVGLHRSTVLRLLRALEAERMVEATGDKYSLGLRLFQLGAVVQRKMEVRRVAVPEMQQLTAATREMSLLSLYDRGEIVYVEIVESPHPVRSVSRYGGRLPAYCTTTGKVLLSGQSREEVERVIAAGLPPLTPNTITDAEQLRLELRRVAQQGYAIDNEELQLEVRGVAAPVRNFRGQIVAAVGIAAPVYRLPTDRLEWAIAAVKECSARISQRLGYREQPHV